MKPLPRLALLLLASAAACAGGPTAPLDIGSRRELFVDRFLIESMSGVELRLHEPQPAPPMAEPANDIEYGTVIKDGDLFRLYTRAGRGARFDGDTSEVTRSCESSDGIHWRKLRDAPVMTKGAFDWQNVSFWWETEKKYVAYVRTFTAGVSTATEWRLDGLRSVSRATSDDFLHWTDPVPLNPNVPGEHIYTTLTHPYFRAPHIYGALPTRFHPDRGASTDILFMTARGDRPFDRTFREAFIRPGLDPARWGNRSNYAALNVVPTGPTEMSIYATPFRRFTPRSDGFASAHAAADPGELRTKPFVFAGDEFALNYSTSAGGSVRLEIQDVGGTPLPGFTLGDVRPLVGDAIDQVVDWKPGSSVAALAGRPVRLRFLLQEADVFALQFRPRAVAVPGP